MRIRTLLPLGMCILSGCATARTPDARSETISETEYVAFDNSTDDVVRVYLDMGGVPMPIGRVDPFATARLRLPAGVTSRSGEARLLVVPIGAPALYKAGAWNASGVRSETYMAHELVQHVWRLSAGRITLVLKPPPGAGRLPR